MTYASVPGFVEEREAHGETTVVVEREALAEAARHLRDEAGLNYLADLAATDYLGWERPRAAGYWGDPRGRDINSPGSWGLQAQPEPKPARFSVSYHLMRVTSGAREAPRLRLHELDLLAQHLGRALRHVLEHALPDLADHAAEGEREILRVDVLEHGLDRAVVELEQVREDEEPRANLVRELGVGLREVVEDVALCRTV